MFLKLIKKSVKIFVIVYLVLLVFRPSKAEEILDCDVTDGSISIVGNEIPVDSSGLFDAYSEIEEKASSLIPSGVNKILSDVSAWIKELFDGGRES